MFLTSDELESLTGSSTARGQRAWLKKRNIDYWLSNTGEIQLCRDVVIAIQMRRNGIGEIKQRRGPAPRV